MHIQHSMKRDSTLKRFILGAHPIIEHFINELRIRDAAGTYLRSDGRMKVDDEQVLCLLIHNILTTPYPLYEIQDWLSLLDVERLGLSVDEAQCIQDDRVGRALAKLYHSRHKEIFFRLALRAIKVFELDCSQIHHDTTTVTFSGRYPGWSAEELLTHGVNKDHRPDLKQLVLGLSVTSDGAVPVTHQIYDGNQTDDRLHPANHKALQKLLQRTDFIYVADCKLATEENLRKITNWGGLFVSVMPRTWKEDEWFRVKVRKDEITWKLILSRRNNRKPDSKIDRYYLAQGEYATSHGYRLHWIRSTQKAEQDAQTRRQRIESTLESLRHLQTKLNAYHLKQRKKISQRIHAILKDNQCTTLITCQIHATRQYKHTYKSPGRPRTTSTAKTVWTHTFSISFAINQDALQTEAKTDGVFPLITNLSPDSHPPKKVLEIYKSQPFLEKRHCQIKTYQEIAPVYLKNGERVVAFLHMHVMALMVSSLIERRLAQAMRTNAIPALPIYPEARACKTPTMFDIARLFKNVERYETTSSDNITAFPAQLSSTQKHVLSLLEIPVAAYQ